MAEAICSIVDCERPVVARGWCSMHWQRWRRHGDPLVVLPHPGPRTDPAERFRSKVDSSDPTGCWPWTDGVDRDGYGHFKAGRRMWRAPRYAFNLANPEAELSDDEQVRHTCDNPVCVRPEHLIRGVAAQNSADQIERDRTTRGDRHHTRRDPSTRLRGTANGSAVLTDEQVRSIRTAYAAGATQVVLAAEHGVTQSHISQIVRRKTWAHLEE
jgi:hypothetical protein